MLTTLAAAGYFLFRARETFPSDVASAAASDEQMRRGGATGEEVEWSGFEGRSGSGPPTESEPPAGTGPPTASEPPTGTGPPGG